MIGKSVRVLNRTETFDHKDGGLFASKLLCNEDADVVFVGRSGTRWK